MTRARSRRSRLIDLDSAVAGEIDGLGFTCYRLVATSDGFQPVELMFITSRMGAFTR
jgi:hypothetical protein